MKVDVYSQQGERVETILLPKEIFGVQMNSDLVHQVVVSQMANKRQVIAHTKDRGEVRGGGRKPWRQKGTGRARHGSRRSPLWKGGGVTFGPSKERVFEKKIPKKMRRKALFMILSDKAKNSLLLILKELDLAQPKTKLMADMIKNLRVKIENFKKGNVLIALPQMDGNIIRASKNLLGVDTIQAKDLNPLALLSFKYLIMPEKSIKAIETTFLKIKNRQ